jgi:hypothetical protein
MIQFRFLELFNYPKISKKSFDNPTVQSSIEVITPVIIKKIKRPKPMSKAYSTRFPP